MSHPGSGPDANPSGEQPNQAGQPVPAGHPYQPFDQQPAQPAGAWTPPPGASGASPVGGPPQKSGVLKKVLPAVGGLAVAGLLFAGSSTEWFGLAAIEVDDCVASVPGSSEVEAVDCGSDEAEAKIVGIEDEEYSFDDLDAGAEVCMEFETADSILWIGDEDSEPGTVYCAESL